MILPWCADIALVCQPRVGHTHSSPQCLGAATKVPADVAIEDSDFTRTALRFAAVKPHRQPSRSSFPDSSSHLAASNRCSCPKTRCCGPSRAIHSLCVVQKFALTVTMEISVLPVLRLRAALPVLRSLGHRRRRNLLPSVIVTLPAFRIHPWFEPAGAHRRLIEIVLR